MTAPSADRRAMLAVYTLACADGPLKAREATRATHGQWSCDAMRETLNELVDEGLCSRELRDDLPAQPYEYALTDAPPSMHVDLSRVDTDAAPIGGDDDG